MTCKRLQIKGQMEPSYPSRGATRILSSSWPFVLVAPLLLVIQTLSGAPPATKTKAQAPSNNLSASQIDRLLAMPPSTGNAGILSAGSTYSVDGTLADLGADFRARHLGDQLTVVVLDSASAVASGVTSEKRQSSANASVTSLFGVKSSTGALANRDVTDAFADDCRFSEVTPLATA